MAIERSTRFFGISYHRTVVRPTIDRPYIEAYDQHRPATRRILGLLGISSTHYLVRVDTTGMSVQKGTYNPGDKTPSHYKTWDVPPDKLEREFVIVHRSILPRPCFRNLIDNTANSQDERSAT